MLNRDDAELDKFRGTPGNTSVAVIATGDMSGLLSGKSYDDIQVTYPNSTTENYAYYLSTSLVATVEVTYTDSSKGVLLRARRV